ncbi:MAG: HD-GYP domain-containing protein [Firmicutes bacterium]|jgi:putative nucleotidyltransferase with HDIG domain|nr:HD-GYP domain-containing protein [Bacillota bacterium]
MKIIKSKDQYYCTSPDKAEFFQMIKYIPEDRQSEFEQSLNGLYKIINSVIRALSIVIEKRDPYTARHQRRVSSLAFALAKEMDLSPEKMEGIRRIGLIHDIGKIAIPTAILNKPGLINEHEFNLIKAHPQAGYDILKEIDFPWPVAEAILQHHERLDGSGYPQGLRNRDIILEARILAVADVVESISSFRPYRQSLGLKFSLEEIFNKRGVLYDKDAVDACLRLFNENNFDFSIV